jgi:hypothetical protein
MRCRRVRQAARPLRRRRPVLQPDRLRTKASGLRERHFRRPRQAPSRAARTLLSRPRSQAFPRRRDRYRRQPPVLDRSARLRRARLARSPGPRPRLRDRPGRLPPRLGPPLLRDRQARVRCRRRRRRPARLDPRARGPYRLRRARLPPPHPRDPHRHRAQRPRRRSQLAPRPPSPAQGLRLCVPRPPPRPDHRPRRLRRRFLEERGSHRDRPPSLGRRPARLPRRNRLGRPQVDSSRSPLPRQLRPAVPRLRPLPRNRPAWAAHRRPGPPLLQRPRREWGPALRRLQAQPRRCRPPRSPRTRWQPLPLRAPSRAPVRRLPSRQSPLPRRPHLRPQRLPTAAQRGEPRCRHRPRRLPLRRRRRELPRRGPLRRWRPLQRNLLRGERRRPGTRRSRRRE